ncbi:DUF4240 domain-containing protein [Paenibacillus kobensis]|uniref:DUF4240 domain-containing protein n=1 Tax=Paenibacillus kobensis TaxID=59841 RepID=UPI000FD93B28|nr:DUF4240 domain-containing protein [Paenibacillus kobensis]
MNHTQFWALIKQSKEHGEEQVEWITNELCNKTVDEILDFEMAFGQFMKQSYTSSLWGAAFVIMGGCSDDGFDYFRGWLIIQGEQVFDKVLADPQYLAEYILEVNREDELMPQCEEALSAALDAYTYLKTGELAYDEDVQTEFMNTLEARGYDYAHPDIEFDWEEDDLPGKYPILWEKFGDEPLT